MFYGVGYFKNRTDINAKPIKIPQILKIGINMGKTAYFDLSDFFRPRRFCAKTPDLFLGTRVEARISGKKERRKNIEIFRSN